MRFLYVTDIHGDKEKYLKLLQIAIEGNYKYIIDGGDMLPKGFGRLEKQTNYINDFLTGYLKKLQDAEITYLCMLGNDDILPMDTFFDSLCKEYDNVHNIANNKVVLNGYEFIGMNYVLDHPFGCKDRVVNEDNCVLQEQLASAFISTVDGHEQIEDWCNYREKSLPKMGDILNKLPIPTDYKKTIYVMHQPPKNVGLGILNSGLDVGSNDIYKFLKQQEPLLSLHGHIHESPDTENGKWITNINNTTCIQPGQTEYDENNLVYVDIDLDNNNFQRKICKVKKY